MGPITSLTGSTRSEPMSLDSVSDNTAKKIEKQLHGLNPLSFSEIRGLYQEVSQLSVESSNDGKLARVTSSVHRLYGIVLAKDALTIEQFKRPTGGTCNGGVNGSYFLMDEKLNRTFVFKPKDEEKEGMMDGVLAGTGAMREALAHRLNFSGTYPIPETFLVKIDGQVGSLQTCVKNPKSVLSVYTSENGGAQIKEISTKELQSSLLFDMRFNNWDRHLGNLLVSEEHLVMIDHGACMSSSPEDPTKMEQLAMPQASSFWDTSLAEYIKNFPEEKIDRDANLMMESGIPENAIERMRFATVILRETMGLEDASEWITPYDLGLFFTRQSRIIFQAESISVAVDFFSHVINEKKKFDTSRDSPSRTEIIKARRLVARVISNPELVNLLYGAEHGSDAPGRLDFGNSILGKFIAYKGETAGN